MDAAVVLLDIPLPADGLLDDVLTHLRTQTITLADALGQDAVTRPPDWALAARSLWQHTAGVLAAYRQIAAVTGTRPLGADPDPATPAHLRAAHARASGLLARARTRLADVQAAAVHAARLAALHTRLAQTSSPPQQPGSAATVSDLHTRMAAPPGPDPARDHHDRLHPPDEGPDYPGGPDYGR